MRIIDDHWQLFAERYKVRAFDAKVINHSDVRRAFFAGAVCMMNLITEVAEIHADMDDLGNNPRLNALLAELEEFTKTLEKS